MKNIIEIQEDTTTGNAVVEAVNAISTYPNPVADVLNVKVDDNLVGQGLVITNVSGAVVYRTIVTDSRFSVSLSNLSKGVYFVRVGNSVRQIIKR